MTLQVRVQSVLCSQELHLTHLHKAAESVATIHKVIDMVEASGRTFVRVDECVYGTGTSLCKSASVMLQFHHTYLSRPPITTSTHVLG